MFGLNIVSTPMAREVRTEWRIERHPTKKRRKQWHVVKHEINRPGAYQSGNTIYAHPEIVEQLRRAVPNAALTGGEAVPVESIVMQQTEDLTMGNTWEIQVWKFVDWRDAYAYEEYWRGESWIAALWNYIKAKREGHGCVTLHWR